MNFEQAERIVQSLDNPDIVCPFCSAIHSAHDPDVSPLAVSYWGDEQGLLSCEQCGEDFYFSETVMRSYSTAPTRDALGE